MKTMLVSYDLGVPETSADYQRLISCIKSYGTWAKPLQSVWLIQTQESAQSVRDALQNQVDSNDKIYVVDVTNQDWATLNISSEVTNWMKTKN